MPHLHRFFVTRETPGTGRIALPPEEAHHAVRVLRLRMGDRVALLDGHGREILATVAEVGKREVVVEATGLRSATPPSPTLSLATGMLQSDKAIEFLIRHGTEVGVDRFVFFRAERSEKAPRLKDKWDRIAVEVCKQSGRLWLPRFMVVANLGEALCAAAGVRILAALETEAGQWQAAVRAADTSVFVGPEGDFSAEETRTILESGALAMSLGESTFRSEVAAVVAAAILRYEMGLAYERTC